MWALVKKPRSAHYEEYRWVVQEAIEYYSIKGRYIAYTFSARSSIVSSRAELWKPRGSLQSPTGMAGTAANQSTHR